MSISNLLFTHRDNTVREPGQWRVLGGALTLLLLATPGLLLGRWAADIDFTLGRVTASVIAGVLFMIVTGALGEWLVHRYLMHRPSRFLPLHRAYHLHHRAHHWVHFPPDAYVQSGPIEYPALFAAESYAVCDNTPARVLTVAAYAVFYSACAVPILAAGWLLTANAWFTAAVVATAAILVFFFIRVHDAVHYPGASRLERFGWFWFLDHHHYIHHIDNRANTNFLLPLGDLVMGTLRLTLNDAEQRRWPSYDAARRLPATAMPEGI